MTKGTDSPYNEGPARNNPVTDLSPTAISIGRSIDRLPAGSYMIGFTKPEIKGNPWTYTIYNVDKIKEK